MTNSVQDLSAIQATLTGWQEKGLHRFNPAGFRYIESMLQSAFKQPTSVASRLIKKISTALSAYQVALNQSQKETEQLIAKTSKAYPEATRELEHLCAQYDYKAVKRRVSRLRYQQQNPFTSLLQQLSRQTPTASAECSASITFSDLLKAQEDDVMQSSATTGESPAVTPSLGLNKHNLEELPSVKLFREALQKRTSDKLIKQVLTGGPENPGPLNPEMLMIRSLRLMGELSPAYLRHFIHYADSLLWLEKASEAIATDTRKKEHRKGYKKSQPKDGGKKQIRLTKSALNPAPQQ